MTTGSTPEENYQLFFDRKCPRPKQGIFENCLMDQWQSFIEETIKELIGELGEPPKLNQIVKGRTGNRTFNQEKLDELISVIERIIRKKLRKTEQGMKFYQEGKNISVKALTFCIIGCRLLKTANEQWNLSKIKSKILNKLLVHYYLEEAEITNSSIQLIEKQIVTREKRTKEQPTLETNEQSNDVTEKYFQIDDEIEIDLESDYLESWEEFGREEEKSLEIDSSQSDMFNFHELITSDDKLTNTLLNFCPKVGKNDITCDVNNESYSLAVIKLIHSFLYKTELFDEIEFTIQCLQDGDYDLKYLRMLVSLYVERYGKTLDWTDKRKDKFLLCSICHIIRKAISFSNFELIKALDVFFKWKGKIYQIDSNEIKNEKGDAFQLLQLNESQVIDDEKHSEEKEVNAFPIDITTMDEEQLIYLYNFTKSCDTCTKSHEECFNIKNELSKKIPSNNQAFVIFWQQHLQLQQCIAKVLIEKYKLGEI